MPDTGVIPVIVPAPASQVVRRISARRFSTLLRRILLVNLLPLALLLAALLYLDQYQNGLLGAEVTTLREQARIYAGALGETTVHEDDADKPRLVPEQARPLLRRLTEPTPSAQARLYAPDGQLIADSRVREGNAGAVTTEPLPPAVDRGRVLGAIARAYDSVLAWLPHGGEGPTLDTGPSAAGPEWQPDVREELRLTGADQNREMPAYIRRTSDDRLLVTVSEPVVTNRHTVGIILLTREAREVDDSLFAVRISILALFTLALGLTVMLSWYLSLTIARPLLRLAVAAEQMREGRGRSGMVPAGLLERGDEIGTLANALSESATALWRRMDAIEQFAADVAHEIKNPLTSIRSAIETSIRIDDAAKQTFTSRDFDDRACALDHVAFADRAVITENNDADIVGFQIEGHALNATLKFHHFAGAYIVEAVNAGDAIADRQHLANFSHFSHCPKIGDFFLENGGNFRSADIHT